MKSAEMAPANKIIAFPQASPRRDKSEIAFLPEALEIVETPPSPVGRMVAVIIIAMFCAALTWACVGQIDIVASAPGKIVPTGRTKVIQPLETGVVRDIRVRDGQSVKAGDILIELDRTVNEAESNHIRSDLMAARLDVARLQAALSANADPLAEFTPPPEAGESMAAIQRAFLLEQVTEHRARLASLDRQRAQKAAERDTIAAAIRKLETVIPVIQERVDIRKILVDHQNVSKITYLENLQLLLEQQQDLLVQQSRFAEAEAALAAITETGGQTEAEYRRTLSAELVEAGRKAAGLAEDLVKADQRLRQQTLTAPVDGVVQQLAVHTIGGVVTPAQALLVLVPIDSRLEIEAMVPNRDIGFVNVGEDAEIKIDTFSFTRYGLLHGRVLSVSQDAVAHDKPGDKPNDRTQGAESSTSEPKGQELVYAARISLDRTTMQVEDKLVALSPGMAVTVEIKTGGRRVISYLLSPLLRYRQESLRER